MVKKVFISQPMNGLSDRAIKEKRAPIVKVYKRLGYEVIDSILNMGPGSAIEYLAESIRLMNDADEVFMMSGWEKTRGCRIEHEVAVAYGKEIIYG